MSFDVPDLYSVLIETKKPVSRLVECGADNVCEQAYALFATDGHMHARVLTLTLEDFDSKKIASNKRKANKLIIVNIISILTFLFLILIRTFV